MRRRRHPFRETLRVPARVALGAKNEARKAAFVKAAFRANFAEDVVAGIHASLEESGEEWIEASRTPENKEALKKQTERAMKLGIFGAPSFVAEGGELFWGGRPDG